MHALCGVAELLIIRDSPTGGGSTLNANCRRLLGFKLAFAIANFTLRDH